ncbi:hypothetical protein [Leptospira borgpetersenii]|uniref:Uncharacterized protein n=2 Tax=Leptospira borgpetersenii serovar Hardjo-bovis TaxID=338217 RepID=Q04VZ2_LEPBJ|nr:hypothetical protein [Leptospira borgpetersenii]ABJ74928.1 Hypothetical protein LBJ_0187 [Leptospira borgpetersenii serovar Hardjo-bovis str. JB197]ABJ80215.1 Hypothetical protein LBL_2896 [Leptospira borgpetersenii serovar Hardjo-bovis str. L550]AMX59681.1 hypothetical protein LBK6_15550 [Leptospira borgpetersenii serovar Hardjo]AMX62909.1 hypothetical protein LBK9_15465 [Leptospira borgpetersenii serovar Hardjo]AMX66152.1 hypothetical protein LBK30_15465 [Leptospira borgpetersenii serovar
MNSTTLKISLFFLLTFSILTTTNNTFADKNSLSGNGKSKSILEAKEYLNSDLDQIFPILQKMKKEEAAILITQIREESRKEWPKTDKFYFLISHLESIKAIEEEHERLKSLNEVYFIGALLLSGFLVFSIFRQRALVRKINAQLSDKE